MLLPSMAEAKLIAGQSGLDRLIRWVYKPEDMHFVKWVRGNELLIISTPPPCLADRRTGRKSGKVDEKRIYENDVSPGNTGEQRPGQSV